MRRVFVLAALVCGLLAGTAHASTVTGTAPGFNLWTNKCDGAAMTFNVVLPDDGVSHQPVVFVHGTLSDWNGVVEGPGMAEDAAAKGFAGVWVKYDSWLTHSDYGHAGHARCMFSPSGSTLLPKLCAVPRVDCSQGIRAVGHSQGASISVDALSHGWVSRVVALGFAMTPLTVDPSKLRVIDGAEDISPTVLPDLKRVTGDPACQANNCLRADGSGYYVVQNAEVDDKVADHCQFYTACFAFKWDSHWRLPAALPYSYGPALDWLRG